MKNLKNVFKFEVYKLISTKAFKVTNIILIGVIIIGLSIPTIMNAFGKPLFGDEADIMKEEKKEKKEMDKYGLVIENGVVSFNSLKTRFLDDQLVLSQSQEELKKLILAEEVEVGFIIKTPTSYEYIVNNANIYDSNDYVMKNALLSVYKEDTLLSKGIEYGEIEEIYNTPIVSETTILGKDSQESYFYTYILIFALYMIILLYGQVIATSVTSEKSNRSMEILVTSTSTKSLIFGKVLAGALVGILHFAGLILITYFAYKFNAQAWDHSLDFIFDIPANILGVFALFGTLGYLLYLFIYSTIGALVSKIEDIGTSMTPVVLVFVAAMFIAMSGLINPDTIIVKVASFIPFTSFLVMFVRVAVGYVPMIQIIISLALLAGTTVLVGVLSSKIYRLGTLMYGNPVKIRTAIKLLREDK